MSAPELSRLAELAAASEWTAVEDAAGSLVDHVPGDPTLWYFRGLARYHLGELAGALADADEAAGLAPGDGRGLRLRAMALLALGRWDDAVVTARLALATVGGAGAEAGGAGGAGSGDAPAPGGDDAATYGVALAIAQATGSTDLVVPVVAGSVPVPVLVVGPRVASIQAERDAWLALHEQSVARERMQRPSSMLRDLRGHAVTEAATGSPVVRRHREIPDVRVARVGLAVMAVLLVGLLAWMCSAPAPVERPSVCRGSALDLFGNPIAPC